MKVAVFSVKPYDREYLSRASRNYSHELSYFEAMLDEHTARLAEGFEAVCIFVNDICSKKTLSILHDHGVRLICLRCAGFNNVDITSAGKYGIKVARVPSYSPNAVAEHAVALILALNRKTHKAYNRIREGNFSLDRLIGFDMYGKTVGVVGTGQIGRAFCRIMSGFGCHLIAYDLYPDASLQEMGVRYVPLDEIYSQSDIISLHCPLTPENYHFIRKETIAKMKKGVMLINTSRGKLIKTMDIIAGLKSKHIGYLGLDVYSQEDKIFFQDLSENIIEDENILRLMTFPNVIITAHQAFFTDNALTQIARTTMENIDAFARGADLRNEVKMEPA